MKANKLFLNQPKSFWANVRTISQHLGYTLQGKKQIKIPTIEEMSSTMKALGLTSGHLIQNGEPTEFSNLLVDYFKHRADVLNNFAALWDMLTRYCLVMRLLKDSLKSSKNG